MFFPIQPIDYDEPLFRPPSEAYSLILQVTLGCSWNNCAFCEMYTSKSFKVRSETEVFKEIDSIAQFYRSTGQDVRKVFLADGNATVLPTARLMNILDKLKREFPRLTRVSSYALPRDLVKKSPQELAELHEAGLKLIYVGIESGDDDVLKHVDKNETHQSTVEGLIKAHEVGIKSSVMILTGLGGKTHSLQHAKQSAQLLNKTQPAFASTLVLGFPRGQERFEKRFKGAYVPMSLQELMAELECFLSHTQLKRTVYRSDHISNFLPLKGTLSRDKDELLTLVRSSLDEVREKPPIAYKAMAF